MFGHSRSLESRGYYTMCGQKPKSSSASEVFSWLLFVHLQADDWEREWSGGNSKTVERKYVTNTCYTMTHSLPSQQLAESWVNKFSEALLAGSIRHVMTMCYFPYPGRHIPVQTLFKKKPVQSYKQKQGHNKLVYCSHFSYPCLIDQGQISHGRNTLE